MNDDSEKFRVQFPASWTSGIAETWKAVSGPASGALGALQQRMFLWQLDNAAEILERVKSLSIKYGVKIGPVLPKFLIPFLEKAGLESQDASELRDAWAKLLICESHAPSALNLAFVEILSSITAIEATMISDIAKRYPTLPNGQIFEAGLDRVILVESVERRLNPIFKTFMQQSENPQPDDIFSRFEEVSSDAPVFIGLASRVSLPIFNDSGEIIGSQTGFTDVARRLGASIVALERLGLLETHSASFGVRTPNFIFSFEFLLLTSLGVKFFNACVAAPSSNVVEVQG